MFEMDNRKLYIISIAETFFSLNLREEDKKDLQMDSSLVNFLDTLSTMLLSCSLKDNSIHCSNQIIMSSDASNILIFLKIKNEPIKMDNIHQNIFFSSMFKSPLRSIYYYILRICAPVLSQGSADNDSVSDPKLEKILKDLEGRLRALLLDPSLPSSGTAPNDAPGDILILLDEVNYWKRRAREPGGVFAELLEPLAVKYLNMNENLDFVAIENLLDFTFNTLDDIWKKEKAVYPEKRMEFILDIIGNDLVAVLQRKFKNIDFWTDDFKVTDEPLRNAINVCEKWILYTQDLTGLYWPNNDSHRWTGKPLEPAYIIGFTNRLKKVYNILAIYFKYKILLKEDERNQLSMDTFFSPFKGLNALQYSDYTESLWNDAEVSFESRLAVLDREAAFKLKTIYQTLSSNILQLLQVLTNYEELLTRPLIKNMMVAEREALLEQLNYLVTTLNLRQESDVVSSIDVPQSLTNIIKAKQNEEKLDFILSAKPILVDLNGYNDFIKLTEGLKLELKNYQTQQFADWTTETSALLRHKGIGMRPDDVVIHFEEGKLMSVNFSKRLVNLIRESRQLKALGYPVSREILQAAEEAQNCIPYAKTLNKIATFHNTIGDHIIRSQKGMMLKNARILVKQVQSQKVVTWRNLKAVEEYISGLQTIVKKLAKDNHQLSQCHFKIMKNISELTNFDMYKDASTWHKQLKTIREIIEEIEKEFSHTLAWRNHIDWQIYKVTECQYRSTLRDIAVSMDQFSVDIYFSEKTIKYRPSIAQLKKEFIHKLKIKYLVHPKSLAYFGDENIYATLIKHNSSYMGKGFQKCSVLFEKLQNYLKSLYNWASLITIDVDSFIETNINSPSDWESNLKTSKFFAQELSKFSRSPVKVECFIISMNNFWNELENENAKLWKTLITHLRESILKKIVVIESFVREELSLINDQPKTVEEYLEVNFKHKNLLGDKEKTLRHLEELDQLDEVLKTWTGEMMAETASVKAFWASYRAALANFDSVFSKKADAIKQKLLESEKSVRKEIELFTQKWKSIKPEIDLITSDEEEVHVEKYCSLIENFKEEWEAILQKVTQLKDDCKKLDISLDEESLINVDYLTEEIHSKERIWALIKDFKTDVKSLADQEWILVRKNVYKVIDNFIDSWESKLQDQETNSVTVKIKKGLEQFKGLRQYFKYFQGETFTEKHWHEIFQLFNKSYIPVHEMVLGDLILSVDDIENKIDEIKEINNRAAAEVVLRQALAELDIWEIETKFQNYVHVDSRENSQRIIKDFKSVISKMEDNLSLLQSISGAAGTAQFLDRISLWERKLSDLDQHVKKLSQLQQKYKKLSIAIESLMEGYAHCLISATCEIDQVWRCLVQKYRHVASYRIYVSVVEAFKHPIVEFVLGSVKTETTLWLYLEPILNKSSLEQSRFGQVTKEFRHILSQIAQNDFRVASLLRIVSIGSILEKCWSLLDHCQKSLMNFLEEKRLRFPRFYFVSDGDLLEMLGQPNNEEVLQSNLKKVFSGVHSVIFDENGAIKAVTSAKGEVLSLRRTIQVSDDIEVWLENLSEVIILSLKELLLDCLNGADPIRFPSQILCLAENIHFTQRCEDAIKNRNLKKLYEDVMWKYDVYTKQIMRLRQEKMDSNNLLLMNKLEALLLDSIEHKQRVQLLINENVTSVTDWNWEKCIRFYLTGEKEVIIRIADAQFQYSYEYLGNQQKLVHTSLTDKCYLALTQALFMGFGGNPYGPAGTGKTESVKSLGAVLGRQVLVFNCDEGLDVESLTRIMIGIVKCGAFGCFDEFNRLEEKTLSLISSQIREIQEALKSKTKSISLLNKNVDVNFNSGIFVTLNPAAKGYGGRQKLPESLKTLFRPVVMSKPDDTDIASVILHCQGFKNGETIAKKLVLVFDLARKILPPRGHYDWGLRALKTVVSGCGHFLKQFLLENDIADEKYKIVAQAVLLNTLCKLSYQDGKQFLNLLSDVFPGIEVSEMGKENFRNRIKEAFIDLKLTPNDRQVQKCLELHELLKQRMGVVVVGPAQSGKSTVIALLETVLRKEGYKVRHNKLNPKSISRNELLGFIDIDTRQWTDGILTSIAQKVCNEAEDVLCWVTCDGDVDPEWVEALNSVLDDNRLLTLPSGWRIRFGDNVNFIFETHQLTHASPATISRMGIVLLSEEDLNADLIIQTWLDLQSIEVTLKDFLFSTFKKALSWLIENGKFALKTSLISSVKSCLALMNNDTPKLAYAINIINGLGANLIKQSKMEFCRLVFELFGERYLDVGNSSDLYYDDETDTIRSYQIDANEGKETSELVLIPHLKVAGDLLTQWLNRQEPILLVGPPASGKRSLINECVKNIYNTELITIECNPQLFSSNIVDIIHQNCLLLQSNNKRIYRPRNAEKLIIIFCHVNLLHMDKWGSIMLVELFKQVASKEGFYDDNLELASFENINFVFTVSSVEKLSPRFIASNHLLYLRSPDTTEMKYIYDCTLRRLHPEMDRTKELSNLMVSIYVEVQQVFHASGSLVHFSPRAVTNWCKNFSRYEIDSRSMLSEAFVNEVNRHLKDKLSSRDLAEFDKIVQAKIDSLEGVINYVPLEGVIYKCDKIEGQIPKLSKTDLKQWGTLIEKITEHEGMDDGNPIFTPDLLCLMAKIECALTEPGGSLLLAGKVGIGRKTALKIISERQNATICFPKTLGKYNVKQFKNDLKSALQLAGINGEECYFFLEDYHIDETHYVLNTLSSVLSSGEVPGLFSSEEFSSLTTSLKNNASENNFQGTLAQFFKLRVCQHFHLVLSFDNDNKKIIKQIKENPVLLNGCYLIRTLTFSDEALRLIPQLSLHRSSRMNEKTKDDESIIKALSAIHKSAEPINNVSPFSFFTFIRTFIRLNKVKKSSLEERLAQLTAGISKITEAKNVVEELKEKAREQEDLLEEKQAKSNAVLEEISQTMANANHQKSEMEDLRRKTTEENITLQLRKQEIDKELAEIEPILQEARAAVGNIKSESLTEIRSLRAPTTVIRDILEAVLRLMGIQDTSWNSMKTFLSQRGIRDEIKFFDASQITKDDRNAVEGLLEARKDSFLPANAKRASLAAAPLASWVTANLQYSKVLEKIRPLTTEQNQLEKNINMAGTKIEELGSGLESVNEAVARLQEQLKATTREGAEIEFHLREAQERSSAAETLVERLSDEYENWQKEHSEIKENLEKLWKSCVLSAAFITYLSNTTEKQRSVILEDWKDLLNINKDFSVNNFLCSENELISWAHEGLPADIFSMQNGIISLHSIVAPLLLDPLSMAKMWLINHFKKESVTVTSPHNKNFMTSIDLSIRFGKVIIVEISDKIPCVLMPILERNFIYQGTRKMVHVGEKLVDYNDNTKLFLIVRDVAHDISFRLLPCPIVNFTTSEAGLTEQLLDSALHVEKPALEQRRLAYIREEDEYKVKLHQMQEDLLEKLACTQGDILKNRELLHSLEITKESSIEIKKTLEESVILKKDLNNERDSYLPLAKYGAKLYFGCKNFNLINDLYQFPVEKFKHLFENSLKNNQIIDNTTNKCKNLLNAVYEYVSRFLLKNDILTFAVHITRVVCPEKIPSREWDVFIGKITSVDREDEVMFNEESIPPWVEPDRVTHLLYLQSSLPSLYEKMNLRNNAWLDFMNISSPHLPKEISLTPFEYLLVIQALRPDLLYSSLVDFVLQSLDLKHLYPTTLKLNKLYLETIPTEPILIITSPGHDPLREISALASTNAIKQVHEVAGGPGCEPQILKLLKECSRDGQWIVVKNLQLITYTLPFLETELRSLEPVKDFRLWLITEPCKNISPGFLNICLKITYESPPGIKRNMERIYDNWLSEKSHISDERISRVLFALAWLHSLLQERRTYIPQGWTSYYEFNDSDLLCGKDTVQRLFRQVFRKEIDWTYVRGLFDCAIYGGRINNAFDQRVLSAYLDSLFKKELIRDPNFQIAPHIRIPRSSDLKEHSAVIKNLPESSNPEFIGLPKNVNSLWEREACLYMIKQLKVLEKNNFQNEVYSFEEQYSLIQPIVNHWKKINQGKNLLRDKEERIEMEDSPIATFFNMELNFALRLVSFINESLLSLESILKERKFNDNRTLIMAQQIQAQQVPEEWEKMWIGSNNISLYLQSVIQKSDSIKTLHRTWMEENNVFDLAHLFNVEYFLAALKQQASRYTKVSIENLWLSVTIGSSVASIKAGSVIVTGLLVEGASISYNKLVENLNESSGISVVPNILFAYISDEEDIENYSKVSIPLYLTDRRDKVVAEIKIPCDSHEKEKWILAGTAFYIRS